MARKTKKEFSAGFVVFYKKNLIDDKCELLLLDHGSHISHPKGHIEKGETKIQTALGLKSKEISFFEGPHTGNNYLTKEMINTIKKQNGNLLRMTFCTLTFITPLYMISQYHYIISDRLILKSSMIIVFLLALIGMFIERYLFFIQSNHVVSLYYGKKI